MCSVCRMYSTKEHVVRFKVEVHPTFDTEFYKILNAIGDKCEDL